MLQEVPSVAELPGCGSPGPGFNAMLRHPPSKDDNSRARPNSVLGECCSDGIAQCFYGSVRLPLYICHDSIRTVMGVGRVSRTSANVVGQDVHTLAHDEHHSVFNSVNHFDSLSLGILIHLTQV